MMIARRRIIESLSKVARWIYKKGYSDFFEGSEGNVDRGLSFSAPSGQRLVLSPYNLKWVNITFPGGTEEHYEKYIGGYVNIGEPVATDIQHLYEITPYDFAPYKQIVIEVESGSGVIGYDTHPTIIEKEPDDTHIVNPRFKLEFNGAGKYVMDISKVNSANYICVGTTQYRYGSPRLIVSNLYFM